MVFHCARDMECRVSHRIDANLDVPLLNVHDSIFDRLRHLHALHEDGQAATCKRAYIDFLARGQPLSRIDDAHLEKFVGELLSFGHAIVIIGTECLEFGDELCDLAD